MSKVKKWYDFKAWEDKDRCPMCNSKLQRKWEGMVCINNCPLTFKCCTGWVYIQPKDDGLFWTLKYDFDITRYNNNKEWLMLKSMTIYNKKCCEVCKSTRSLHVHHILPRSSNPELALDVENLMVLCESCHRKIHSKDKYSFYRENNG